jgi:ligand-binding sensor domain-containing protein
MNNMMRIAILLIHILFIGDLSAQNPNFRLLPLKDLGNIQLSCVFQDSSGWIWLGAPGKLLRYDGFQLQSVLLPDTFLHQTVTALFQSRGKIWVGFNQGSIGCLPAKALFLPISKSKDTRLPSFQAGMELWQPEEGLPTKKITGFAEDGSGGFWFSTYGEGVYCAKGTHIYQFNQQDDGLANDEIYSITRDGNGRIWVGTDAGISICTMNIQGQKSVKTLNSGNSSLPDEIITALNTDVEGNVLIGTYDRGVCRYLLATDQINYCTPNWSYGPVTSMAAFGTDELWIGTTNSGLIKIDTYTGAIQTQPATNAGAKQKIRALCKDREGLLWVINDKGQLLSANMRFGLIPTPYSDIQAICMDHLNRMWIGTKQGLFLYQNDQFQTLLSPNENILSLWEAPNGHVWAGSFGNGIFQLDAQGKVKQHLTEKNGLLNGSILSISGNANMVWLATLGGVSSLLLNENGKVQQISQQNELGSSYVYKVYADHSGGFWFCTDGKGLLYFKDGQFKHFPTTGTIPLKTIYSIVEDAKGHIWFSTDKEGLFCYDGKKFEQLGIGSALHSQVIAGLAVAGKDELAIAYEDGLDLLQLDRKAHVRFYDAQLGASLNATSLNALCTEPRGHVWIGSERGLLRLAAFQENFIEDPLPSITAVAIFDTPFDFFKKNKFAYNENYFTFQFTGLWYTNPESVRYRYRLEGFDLDWKISKDHLASYPKLPPGTYTFRIQTSEHGNFEGVPEVSWQFQIRRPFWLSWWFITLAALLLFGGLYGLIFLRETRLKKAESLKKAMVESQFSALKSQISPHFLFNSFNTLITIIEENPVMAVSYVEHLSDFYRTIIVYRERDLIPLQEELVLVRNFGYLLKKRYEDNFFIDVQNMVSPGQIMPLTLQILVENAVKHNIISAAHPLRIEILETADGYIAVRNNIQHKIKPEPGTHFGLKSLIERYALLGERPVQVHDDGLYFTVQVPIVKTSKENATS